MRNPVLAEYNCAPKKSLVALEARPRYTALRYHPSLPSSVRPVLLFTCCTRASPILLSFAPSSPPRFVCDGIALEVCETHDGRRSSSTRSKVGPGDVNKRERKRDSFPFRGCREEDRGELRACEKVEGTCSSSFKHPYPRPWKLYYADLGRALHYANGSIRSACKPPLLTDFNYVTPRARSRAYREAARSTRHCCVYRCVRR